MLREIERPHSKSPLVSWPNSRRDERGDWAFAQARQTNVLMSEFGHLADMAAGPLFGRDRGKSRH